jgi:hypothetical protein
MTIYRRGGKHCVSVYDPLTQKMRWVGSYASLDEARSKEAAALAGPTCDEYVDTWLVDHPRPAPGSNRIYRRRARPFATAFQGVPIASLEDTDLAEWALTQPHGVFETTRALLNDAIADNLYAGPNPLKGFRRARPPKRPPRIVESDLRHLADCAIDVWGTSGFEVFAPLIVVTAYQRLMLGEVAALRHDDVQENSLIVHSNGAWWEMDLTPEAKAAITSVPVRPPGCHVFTSKAGSPLSSCRIAYYWNPIRAVFGRPSLRFDDIRFLDTPRKEPARHFLYLDGDT